MVKTLDVNNFIDEFRYAGRATNFSREGLEALFKYLTSMEDESNPTELDVIAICCDFSEYDDLEEVQRSYPDVEEPDDLADHTSFHRELDNGHIIMRDF